VLGRIAFLAAALDKPGIFTGNVELHRRLYPGSLVKSHCNETLPVLVKKLLQGLAERGPLEEFRPDGAAAQEIGDFAANASRLRQILLSQDSAPHLQGFPEKLN
jgi:hypothetical protein